MATATLQSFNVFLTDRLTAAAVDIYGFVEKTIVDYQEEVHRAKMENQRLQRLLDLVYKPEIRLRRADSSQSSLPRPTQEVCALEPQIQRKCIVSEAKEEPAPLRLKEERTEPWTVSVETLAHADVADIQIAADGERVSNLSPGSLNPAVPVKEQGEHEAAHSQNQGQHTEDGVSGSPPCDPLTPSFRKSRPLRKRKRLSCDICCQGFLLKADLTQHLTSHVTKMSPEPSKFTCTVCGKRLKSESQMVCDMRAHTDEKPYGCSFCSKRYKLKGHMKEHVRTHTGERPYSCYICGRNFNRSSTMRKHAKIKHSEDMAFRCTLCSQRFPLLVVFRRHMRAVHHVSLSV